EVQQRWSRIFSIASIITPVLLGLTLGAIASGTIKVEGGVVVGGFWSSWLAPFPFSVGFFALSLFAFLAAVYLTLEAKDEKLQEDFRLRALVSGLSVGFLALLVFLLSGTGAPSVRAGLTASPWALPLHLATALCAVGALYFLWTRRYAPARLCAALQVSLILWGWALAQFPYLVEPNITISAAAAPHATLRLLLIALGLGALLLFPSFYYLFRVFKGQKAFALRAEDEGVAGVKKR
ncbi:MAG TPA: cytochrome d ubiquinol oxidase subunit II, partial [Pyrinomonadaceae bacterium]|nr:cytochrome d ubiquinol oxidase subunit II [Pyrinomonadaceae bacterium]